MAKNQYKLERPRNKAKLIELITDGATAYQCSQALGVTVHSIEAFKIRHEDDLAEHRRELESRLSELAIANKYQRIRESQIRWDAYKALRQARAQDSRYTEPGYSTGLLSHKLRGIGSGSSMVVVDEYEIDHGLSAEMRQLERSVAEELGQLPRTGDTGSGNLVLIREVNITLPSH